MRSRLPLLTALVVVLATLLLGVAASAGPGLRTAAPVVEGSYGDTSTPFNLVDVPALVRHRPDGHDLSLDTLLVRQPGFERWAISYRGDGLRLTGALTLPRTGGQHPVVVVAHGFAPPGRYLQGAGTSREETVLGRQGYAVLHPDFRSWGGSQLDPGHEAAHPLGYPEDLLNAVAALRRAHLPGVDLSRTALLGRSMGGAVATQAAVARPGWFKALVLYSSVSLDAVQDARRWVRPGTPLAARVRAAYGTPAGRPGTWRAASVSSYLDRLGSMPVSIHHGTADRVCPPRWSAQSAADLRADGARVSVHAYPGEHHRFARQWPRFMARASAFLGAALRR